MNLHVHVVRDDMVDGLRYHTGIGDGITSPSIPNKYPTHLMLDTVEKNHRLQNTVVFVINMWINALHAIFP
jgi:hypothetical protein